MKRLAEISLESRVALASAICGHNDIPAEESEENIRTNLVNVCDGSFSSQSPDGQICMKGGKGGSGLMITTDGWIVTAYHNIKLLKNRLDEIAMQISHLAFTEQNIRAFLCEITKRCGGVVDQNKKLYPINPFMYFASPQMDIALIKAMTDREPAPVRFKVSYSDLKLGDEIMLFGLKNQRLYSQYGKVTLTDFSPYSKNEFTEEGSVINDTFLTDAYGTSGFSGGAFTTLKGEFAGLSLYKQKQFDYKGEIGCIGGAKAKNIAQLVNDKMKELAETK
ncbi:trypsin-like peptidase domain-containing protein [Candidatus Woesearchaeota archaeon]|nr:trypsin-like peptidase domain-containing protein [Candidatus Woesearchaeota archaeon]